MTGPEVSKPKRVTSGDGDAVSRLFVLDLSGNSVFSVNPDGSYQRTLVTECGHPDGIVVDAEAGHIYWTNMGVPNLNDGSIERADLDGQNRKIIIPKGGTHTPKQIHLDKENGKLYWSDREGMRVMCSGRTCLPMPGTSSRWSKRGRSKSKSIRPIPWPRQPGPSGILKKEEPPD